MRPTTPSQTVGPFFEFCLTPDASRGIVFPGSLPRARVRIRVLDAAGDPVPDAVVEIWQAGGAPGGGFGMGRLSTRGDGTCEFDTIRPCAPPSEAAHINICLFARGLLRHLHTRLYFAGDPCLATDPVLAIVPEARRPTLIAQPEQPDANPASARSSQAATYAFTIRLQGADETVFFDV